MKKFILMASLFCMSVASLCVTSKAAAQPALLDLAAPKGRYSLGSFPAWHTTLDTVGSSGVDTMKLDLFRGWVTSYNTNTLNSITFTNSVLKVAGTPTVTVTLYAMGDADTSSYPVLPVAAFTVMPTSLTIPVKTNYTFMGNPDTKYAWAFGNSASATVSCKSTVTIR